MEHDLELIIARLEILEIEVCNIIYKPRDIGNLSFSTSSYPGNIGKRIFLIQSYPGNIGKWIFLISHILEILENTIQKVFPNSAGATRLGGKASQLLISYPNIFSIFWDFPKKTRAEISRRMHRRMSRDLSYETDSGPKTKTVFRIIFALFSYSFHIFGDMVFCLCSIPE